MIYVLPLRSKSCSVLFFILFFIGCSATSVLAASGYISDRLIIYLKDSTEEPSNSVARVQTGDKVEIIGTKEDFHLVKTEDGKEGWILKQYILFSQPKEIKIKTLQSEKENLQKLLAEEKKKNAKKFEELRRTFAASSDQSLLVEKVEELDQAIAQRDALLQKNKELQVTIQAMKEERKQLKQDKNKIIELNNSRKELQKKVAQLRAQLDAKKQGAVNRLGLDPRISWFMAGAFVLLVGMLIGKTGKKKQKSKYHFTS